MTDITTEESQKEAEAYVESIFRNKSPKEIENLRSGKYVRRAVKDEDEIEKWKESRWEGLIELTAKE